LLEAEIEIYKSKREVATEPTVNCTPSRVDNGNQKPVSSCSKCIKINRELNKAKEELLNYKEIVKMLQAETSEKIQVNKKVDSEQSKYNSEHVITPNVQGDWVMVP
jgi:aspartyl/asparaginyl-tRNA synthetase